MVCSQRKRSAEVPLHGSQVNFILKFNNSGNSLAQSVAHHVIIAKYCLSPVKKVLLSAVMILVYAFPHAPNFDLNLNFSS
jgi:hypothetical protein